MKIHKEGHQMLSGLSLILFAINFGIYYFFKEDITLQNTFIIISVVVFISILQFFRIPSRKTEIDDKKVYSPCDGKVVVIEDTHEGEYFKNTKKQISIFMSPINVHNNKNPVSGNVKYFKYHPGKYLVAWHPKSSTENERTTLVVQMANGVEILMRQIAGALAKRIKCYVREGQKVQQGEEFGFIKFGSRVDIFLPPEINVKVKIGDKSVGGKTVLAEFS